MENEIRNEDRAVRIAPANGEWEMAWGEYNLDDVFCLITTSRCQRRETAVEMAGRWVARVSP